MTYTGYVTYVGYVIYMGCVIYRGYATYGGYVTYTGEEQGDSLINVGTDGRPLGFSRSIFAQTLGSVRG